MRIAVLGKMRSGKDSFARIFIKSGFTELKFSDGITEIIGAYFPEALNSGKPRKHYQHIGQHLRELNEDVWVNNLARELLTYPVDEDIIITDVRQSNEVNWLIDNGFIIIKIVASDEIRKARIAAAGDNFDESMFNHETEQGIDEMPFHYLISNEGSLGDLGWKALSFITLDENVDIFLKGGETK